MNVTELLVFCPKYRHVQTHTKTRNTCANTYLGTQSNLRHISKHKTQAHTHQQVQTHTYAHKQYRQPTHKNTKKHDHGDKYMRASKEGADGCTWVAWDSQGQYGTGGRKKWVCRDKGGHGGHVWTRIITEDNHRKKNNTTNRPHKTSKTVSTTQQKISISRVIHL